MAVTDTSEAARQRQLAVYATTPGADKILLSSRMAEQAKAIAMDGIRSRRPELDEAEVHTEWLKLLHGDLARYLARS